MEHITAALTEGNSKQILIASHSEEKLPTPSTLVPCSQAVSQVPNNCSVPKSTENKTENLPGEKSTDGTYAERRQKCMTDIETLTGKALNLTYPKEYKTWSNSKNRSQKLKNITGPHWGSELDTFPGFLKQTGPKRNPDDSLDRIDPSYGYVVGNIRWASKQLQSENRKNVETIMVRGTPMTRPQLANFLGMTYDALRMRFVRGETAEEIVAARLRPEGTAVTTAGDQTEPRPWPKGKEHAWEEAYKRERHRLLQPHERDSRTAFFVAKCQEELRKLHDYGHRHLEMYGPEVPMPDSWIAKRDYWQQLLFLAQERRQSHVARQRPRSEVGPSPEELAMIRAVTGGPPTITDEDMLDS